MPPLRTIEGVEVQEKRVLVRVDVNVDLDDEGHIESEGDHRLHDCLPTVQYLRDHGARVILMSHIGRPEGRVVDSLRIARVADRLSALLGTPVRTLPVTVGREAVEASRTLGNGEVLFLENLRFDPREEQNDPSFARELAKLGDLYVNEAFAVSHRAHASLVAITEYLPSYAGIQFAKEVEVLETIMERPAAPVVAVISGAKIETKAALLRNLLPKVDQLLTGGGIANMFLLVQGFPVGTSLVEPHMKDEVTQLWQQFQDKILLPSDVRVSRAADGKEPYTIAVDQVEPTDMMYDIGPITVQRYCTAVSQAKTCLWNGPLGKVELPEFQWGTREFAKCVRVSDAYSVVGGGDTVTALRQMHLADGFGHLSSGGGALIAFLEGAELPAVAALRV